MSAPHWYYGSLRRGCAVLGILLGELLAIGPLGEDVGLAGQGGLLALVFILTFGLFLGLVGMWSVDVAAGLVRRLRARDGR